ncbi:MAG: hypothetical protein HKN21_06515, partial [Candidatus Eisenbacteria bacterium]|nr:hypothetical protein [Candidatus Eisenbacteria bacterium]
MNPTVAPTFTELHPVGPDTPNAELRTFAKEAGYLFCPGLLPPDRVDALANVYREYAREAGLMQLDNDLQTDKAKDTRMGLEENPVWVGLQVKAQNHDAMWRLGDSRETHDMLDRATDGSSYLFLSYANCCRMVSPHPEIRTKPHQDAHYVTDPKRHWTVWIPLTDCPRELGGLAVSPGSYRLGLLPHFGKGIVDAGAETPEDL